MFLLKYVLILYIRFEIYSSPHNLVIRLKYSHSVISILEIIQLRFFIPIGNIKIGLYSSKIKIILSNLSS